MGDKNWTSIDWVAVTLPPVKPFL